MRALVGVLVASVLAPAWGVAQTLEVSAPFVSRLKAQAEGTSIVLTWQDSVDVRGPLSIYRHTAELTAETLSAAQRLAEVPYGTGVYTDHPPDGRQYFYAVLASDPLGRLYDVLIPFRNKTLSASAVEDPGGQQDSAARVTFLRAEGEPGAIRVSFAADRPGRTLVLYRSTTAIVRFSDLLGAVALIVEPAVSVYADTPPAGIPFYYAMADEELVKLGKATFVPGESCTAAPASIPLVGGGAGGGAAARSASRSRPLPYLVLERGVYSGEGVAPAHEVPSRKEIGQDTGEAVAALLAGLPQPSPQPMRPVVLDIDRAEAGGGEEFLLHAIVRETVATADSGAAEARLRSFLSIRRDPRLEARARFYLGQALYFQRRRAEALVEMLLAVDLYNEEARPWLDRCLDELAATQ